MTERSRRGPRPRRTLPRHLSGDVRYRAMTELGQVLTLPEAIEQSGRARMTVLLRLETGQLQGRKTSSGWLISRTSLQALIEEGLL